jgi:hypothetical protein
MPPRFVEFAEDLRSWWGDAKIDCPLHGSAVPSKVIIRPQAGSLLFITQPDHAALAADLVAHFDGFASSPRRQAIHLAVREHDAGWHDPDDTLVFEDATGKALDFVGVPESLKQSVWPVAIDRIADRAPYAAALIAEHASFVYSANREKPAWHAFFAALEDRRAALLHRCDETLATLQADYPLLGIADLLSLSFCHGWTEPKERFGRSIRCAGAAVEIAPSLLPAAPIAARVRARRVPDQRYASAAALRDALASATPEFLTGVARGGPLA